MYKNARWQTADLQFRSLRQLFDGHYKEQIQLVDVLVDRMRVLNCAGGGYSPVISFTGSSSLNCFAVVHQPHFY
jgi:DNA-binding ferritin-like protein